MPCDYKECKAEVAQRCPDNRPAEYRVKPWTGYHQSRRKRAERAAADAEKLTAWVEGKPIR